MFNITLKIGVLINQQTVDRLIIFAKKQFKQHS